jgi:hypothetical protein
MATLTIPNTFVDGTTIVAAEHNANFTSVKNFVDALSSGANFDAGAINSEDIASNAITTAKIATGAVTGTKIQTSVVLTTPNIGAATGTSLNTTGAVISHSVPTSIVGAYTLILTDDGKIIEKLDTSGVAVTIPPDSSVNFPVGTQIVFIQTGAGQTEIVGGAGVVVNGTPGTKLRTQYSSAVCLKRAANLWILLGDLSA